METCRDESQKRNGMESKNNLFHDEGDFSSGHWFSFRHFFGKNVTKAPTTHFNVRSIEGTMGLVILGYKLADIT